MSQLFPCWNSASRAKRCVCVCVRDLPKYKTGPKSLINYHPGVYKVTPRSCHQFEQDFYTYDT